MIKIGCFLLIFECTKSTYAYVRARTPQNPHTYITCAQAFTSKEFKYNLMGNNCEHFVTYCVFGSSFSYQSDDLHKWITQTVARDYICWFLVYFGANRFGVTNLVLHWLQQLKFEFPLILDSSLTDFVVNTFNKLDDHEIFLYSTSIATITIVSVAYIMAYYKVCMNISS